MLSQKSSYEGKYLARMRRVRALVEVDGVEREMEFLTNNMDWSPRRVADLYRSRWSIEVFFKQIKQTLKLADFLGHSANAVRWQVWSALLCYLSPRRSRVHLAARTGPTTIPTDFGPCPG